MLIAIFMDKHDNVVHNAFQLNEPNKIKEQQGAVSFGLDELVKLPKIEPVLRELLGSKDRYEGCYFYVLEKMPAKNNNQKETLDKLHIRIMECNQKVIRLRDSLDKLKEFASAQVISVAQHEYDCALHEYKKYKEQYQEHLKCQDENCLTISVNKRITHIETLDHDETSIGYYSFKRGYERDGTIVKPFIITRKIIDDHFAQKADEFYKNLV